MVTGSATPGQYGDSIWPWRVFLTVIPLIMALIALQVFVPVSDLRATMPAEWWASQLKPPGYSGGFIGYAAATCVHLLICVAVIVYSLRHIYACAATPRRVLLILAALYALTLITLLSWWNDPGLVAYKITFVNLRDLYLGTELFGRLDGILGLYVILPTAFGIVAVIFAAAAAESLFVGAEPGAEAIGEKELKAKISALKRGFQALSAVLVSSTFTAALFFHLPARLYLDKGEGKAMITAYADEVSIFWGAIFTLTLLATYAPQFLRLRSFTRAHASAVHAQQPDRPLPDWLRDEALFGNIQSQIGAILTLLAPLLTGSIGSAIQAMAA